MLCVKMEKYKIVCQSRPCPRVKIVNINYLFFQPYKTEDWTDCATEEEMSSDEWTLSSAPERKKKL
jgi:hypothetical protein